MDGITQSIKDLDLRICEYAVLNPATVSNGQSTSPKLLSDLEPSDELREIEKELGMNYDL